MTRTEFEERARRICSYMFLDGHSHSYNWKMDSARFEALLELVEQYKNSNQEGMNTWDKIEEIKSNKGGMIQGAEITEMLADGTVRTADGRLWYWVDTSHCGEDTGWEWVASGEWREYMTSGR